MENQDDQKFEVIDKKPNPLNKFGGDVKQFIGNMVDKIGELPNFAKELLNSTEKSEENYKQYVKQDKDTIETIIKQKLESGNYTNEELEDLLNRTEKITKDQEGVLDKLNKHKKEILLILSASMVATIKLILENRNKAS